MTDLALTLTDLKARGRLFLQPYRFDNVAFNYFTLSSDGGVILNFYVYDDFQKSLSWDAKIGVGAIELIYENGLLRPVGRIMGRGERELRVLAQTNAAILDNRAAFTSAAAQTFIDVLQNKNAELGGLLVDLSAPVDDEIPF